MLYICVYEMSLHIDYLYDVILQIILKLKMTPSQS